MTLQYDARGFSYAEGLHSALTWLLVEHPRVVHARCLCSRKMRADLKNSAGLRPFREVPADEHGNPSAVFAIEYAEDKFAKIVSDTAAPPEMIFIEASILEHEPIVVEVRFS